MRNLLLCLIEWRTSFVRYVYCRMRRSLFWTLILCASLHSYEAMRRSLFWTLILLSLYSHTLRLSTLIWGYASQSLLYTHTSLSVLSYFAPLYTLMRLCVAVSSVHSYFAPHSVLSLEWGTSYFAPHSVLIKLIEWVQNEAHRMSTEETATHTTVHIYAYMYTYRYMTVHIYTDMYIYRYMYRYIHICRYVYCRVRQSLHDRDCRSLFTTVHIYTYMYIYIKYEYRRDCDAHDSTHIYIYVYT
jgi:hypothetical protein